MVNIELKQYRKLANELTKENKKLKQQLVEKDEIIKDIQEKYKLLVKQTSYLI